MAIAAIGQLFFEYVARDEARRRSALLLQIADVELQLSNEKSKINRPRSLPLGALISHACSTERGIGGAAPAARARARRLSTPSARSTMSR